MTIRDKQCLELQSKYNNIDKNHAERNGDFKSQFPVEEAKLPAFSVTTQGFTPALALFQNVLRPNGSWCQVWFPSPRSSVGAGAAEQGLWGHSRACPAPSTASKTPDGLHLCPKNHISHFTTRSLKKSMFRFTHLFCPPGVQPTQHPPLQLSEEEKVEPDWGRAGAWELIRVSKAAAAQRSLQ